MKLRIKSAFASLAVATLCTVGASSQASAFDLLDELLGGDKYVDAGACGCSQKSVGQVQKCGSKCGGKGVAGHVQHSGGKLGHVQRSKGGHVQHSLSKSGKKGGDGKSKGHGTDWCGMVKAKMAELKCKLASHHGKGKGKGKGGDLDPNAGGLGYSGSTVVPAPEINQGYQSVPVPPNPDPST